MVRGDEACVAPGEDHAMAIDMASPTSRRALLAAVLGGVAAAAAQVLGRPAEALAADGDPIIHGADVGGIGGTIVRSSTTTALQGVTDTTNGASHGVRGRTNSASGVGVFGTTFATGGSLVGVLGTSLGDFGVGVKGDGGFYGVQGYATRAIGGAAGVFGNVDLADGVGVVGTNSSEDPLARGMFARATGVGLDAEAEGTAGSVGVRGKSWSLTNGVGIKGIVDANGADSIGVK